MKTESAIFTRNPASIGRFSESFDRIYFGEEFCEDLMPSFGRIRSALSTAIKYGMKFTLLTPLCRDESIKKITGMLIRLSDEGFEGEVVLSDWGLLDEVTNKQKDKISWIPVLGRSLTRQKSGPRMIRLDEIQPDIVKTARKVPLGAGAFMDFLIQRQIYRLEFDMPLHGIDIRLPDGFHGSIYHPWVFVSLSRICPVKDTVSKRAKRCGHDCLNLPAKLFHPDMPVPLLVVGRTVYYENPSEIKNIEESGIDRKIHFNPLEMTT